MNFKTDPSTLVSGAIVVLALGFASSAAMAQQNRVTLSGGYAFANYEDITTNATGWRMVGLYEFNPMEGAWAHGVSVGYASLGGTATEGLQTVTLDVGSWSVCYHPKFLFGKEKFKGFVKGSFGWQRSDGKRSGTILVFEDADYGFSLGGGAGAEYHFNEKFFLNLEYELFWMNNSLYYQDGLLNTASLGIAIKF